MKLPSIRSWSFPPPAYEETSTDSPEVTTTRQTLPRMRTPRLLSTWLLTFDKQWLLVHCCSVFACFALLATGMASFVTGDLDTMDENKASWLAGATAMISSGVTSAAFRGLVTGFTPNHSQTLEQQSTYKFLVTVFSVLAQVFVAAMQVAVTTSLPGTASGQLSSRMQLLKNIATISAILCVISAFYDIVKLWKDRKNESSGEEWDDNDDAFRDDGDAENQRGLHANSRASAASSGPIRLV